MVRPVFESAAASLPDEQRTNPVSAKRTRIRARHFSAANTQPLDQRLVTRLIDAGEIIEQLATLGHELEQSTPGMIVLDVGLEMLGEAVDALRQDRHLHLRRSGVAGLGRIGLDDLGLAAGRNRHRVVLSGYGSYHGRRPSRDVVQQGRHKRHKRVHARLPTRYVRVYPPRNRGISKPRSRVKPAARPAQWS